MPTSSFTSDATIVPRLFTADAWILGTRQRHHRVRDHFGVESDLYVGLSEDIGKYVAFTPIHWVLADLVTRLERLENSTQVRASFSADAWIAISGTYGRGVVFSDAVIRASATGSFTVDAVLLTGGSFSADAVIMPSFTADAFII